MKPRKILHLTDSLYAGSSSASAQSSLGFSWDNLQSNFGPAKQRIKGEHDKIVKNLEKKSIHSAELKKEQIAPDIHYMLLSTI